MEYPDCERRLSAIPNAENTGSIATAELDLLTTLSDASIVPNFEPFECPICLEQHDEYDGVILRDCFHIFCRECLASFIKYANDVVIHCPYKDNNNTCYTVIQDREMKCLLNEEEYNKYLERSLNKAERVSENAFHCKMPDCIGWCIIDENINMFECPVCNTKNCLKCKALHAGISCEDYQDKLSGNYENRRSEQAIATMLAGGVAMLCPKCTSVVEKISGCDNIVCSSCKTELCWATRGLRWGPRGKGDTSGGCRCNVDGKKCHPYCTNCH